MKPILINLDLKNNSYEDIELKQGCQDTLIATITDSGDVVDLTGQVIAVEMLKGDNTFIIQTNDITVSTNKVTIILNKDFTRVKGKTKLQIKMTKGGVVSGSWVVVAWVRQGAIDSAIGESGNIVTIKEELDKSIVKATEENKKTQDLIATGGAATTGQVATLSSQMAEKANQLDLKISDGRLSIKEKQVTPLGVQPILPPCNIKILSTVDNNVLNYVDGSSATVSGTLTYEQCMFYKGAKIESNQMLKYPLNLTNDVKSGTIFLRFKPIMDFNNSLNMEYPIFELADIDGVGSVSAKFNYLDVNNYNGIEVRIRRGSDLQQLVLINTDFSMNKIYTLAVVWDFKDGEGNGSLAVYIDGLIKVATTVPTTRIPKASARLDVGNYSALNRPMKCTIEQVLYATEKIETSGILKLHREPLKLESVYNNYIYNPKYETIGYKREKLDYTILCYHNSIMYGVKSDNFGILLQSKDEGNTWQTFYDFKIQNPTELIDNIYISENNIAYVSTRIGNKAQLKRSTLDNLNFQKVIDFSDGFYCISWNIDSLGEKVMVSEYGQSVPKIPARVFLSIDNGVTFNVIKTLNANTEHIHSTRIDPYTGYLWLTFGDATDGTEYSVDNGVNWITVNNEAPNQSIGMVFTQNSVVFASDSVAGGSLLRVYDKNSGNYGRLVNPTFRYLNHVYALNMDDNGYIWWFGNREQMVGKVNTISISTDFGATPILLEDLGEELVSKPYAFIFCKDSVYLGNMKFSKPILNVYNG